MNIFQSKFPNIVFEIGNSENPIRELEIKKYDLIITAASSPVGAHRYSPLFKDQMVYILPENHLLSTQPYIHLQDFSRMDFISHADIGEN
jgi:DNA-binding transcriptional LysR family regulator